MGDFATPTVAVPADSVPEDAGPERAAPDRDPDDRRQGDPRPTGQEQKGLYPPRHPGRSQRMIGEVV
ncbi:MAG: hypothetical protein ACLPUT_00005, partial [Solirubrobacteraceae bacterium]